MLLQVLKRFSAPIHSLDIICKIKPTSALNIFYRAGIVSIPSDLLRNLSFKEDQVRRMPSIQFVGVKSQANVETLSK